VSAKGAQRAVLLYRDETRFKFGDFVTILCCDFVEPCSQRIDRYDHTSFVAFQAQSGAKLCKRFDFMEPR